MTIFTRFDGSKRLAVLFTLIISIMTMAYVTSAKSVDSKSDNVKPTTATIIKQNYDAELCWKHETFLTKSQCMQCESHEKDKILACKETGNKQEIMCEKSKTKAYVSCPFVTSVEKKRFWTFEAASLVFALLSNAVVWWRRRSLQQFHYQRVKRQMSDSSV